MTRRHIRPQFWLAIPSALLIAGCATTYTPTEATVAGMNLAQARTMFTETAYAATVWGDQGLYNKISEVRIEDHGATITLIFSNQHDIVWPACSFSTSRITQFRVGGGEGGMDAVDLTVCKMSGVMWNGAGSPERAKEFVNAAYVLSHGAAEARRQEDAAFAGIAEQYRSAAVKPTLPIEAQKYATQANDAFKDKQNDEAVDLYGKAIEAAPWWPQAHYNRAILMSDQGNYGDAISEMQKYLALVPNASNAAQAQSFIWKWQRHTADPSQP